MLFYFLVIYSISLVIACFRYDLLPKRTMMSWRKYCGERIESICFLHSCSAYKDHHCSYIFRLTIMLHPVLNPPAPLPAKKLTLNWVWSETISRLLILGPYFCWTITRFTLCNYLTVGKNLKLGSWAWDMAYCSSHSMPEVKHYSLSTKGFTPVDDANLEEIKYK